MNAERGRILGPSRSQEVQQGDSVEIGVFGKYVDPKKIKLSPATFARTGMDRKIIRTLGEYGQNLAASPNEIAIANVIALVISELQQKPVPEAYMGYALYDSDSNRYEVGKVVLSKKARNKHEELIQKIAIKKDGYIETYLVNETSENVWFDQFRIMSTGPLIVQETHYDPWGVELSGLGYQYGGIKVNPYLYNGKELTSGLGVIMYDYGARLYIPAIGRWFVSDPLAEKARRQSPYNYALNNPLRFIDPDGMEAYSVMGGITVDGYLAPEDVNMPISPNGGGKEIQRKNAERAKQQQESRNRVNNEIRQRAGLSINENMASILSFPERSLPNLIVEERAQNIGSDLINPSGGALRGQDAYGNGHFGASRDGGGRKHMGIDILTTVGQNLVSPVTGSAVNYTGATFGKPMIDITPSNSTLGIDKVRILYVNIPSGVNAWKKYNVTAGQTIIGTAANLGSLGYPKGITPHIHVQIMVKGNWVDPTPYFFGR